jgi:hypothetical protein
MKKYRIFIYVALVSILIIDIVAASLINLSTSDHGPFEQVFPGECAHPVVSVLYEDPTKPNPKVIEVDLTGDFSNCVGSQVLVTTYKTGHIHRYAVADIAENQATIQLSFLNHGGDFHQKFPLVVNNRLVSDGPIAPSSDSIDPAEISVIFAWSWI